MNDKKPLDKSEIREQTDTYMIPVSKKTLIDLCRALKGAKETLEKLMR
jgi:hypothetical protein